MCKHWSKLFLQVEVLNFSPVGISKCRKGEKFSSCSFSHGENMRSLISLIAQASIYSKPRGTRYLCGQSPGGVLTKRCSRTWKFFDCTNTHDIPVSTDCLRNPPEILQPSSFVSVCKEKKDGTEKGKSLIIVEFSVCWQRLGQAQLPWAFRGMVEVSWLCLCDFYRLQKTSSTSLFSFYFPPSSKWSHKQLCKTKSELLQHLHLCSLLFLSSCSSFCYLKILFFTVPRNLGQ